MLYSKKGQLEIGITMMTLLVFIILLVVSLIFYFRFSQENIKETKQQILDEKYSGLLDALINLPELRYSLSGAEKNCLDIIKLDNFKVITENSLARSEYYINLLGDVNAIWVDAIYIDSTNPTADENGIVKEKEKYIVYRTKGEDLIYSSPISICKSNNEFDVGILNIQIK